MFEYDDAKALMIQSLSRALAYHEAGAYEKLGEGFDMVDIKLPRHQASKFLNLYIALQFWDGWIDASNHQWQYYPGIQVEDWPRLARQIIDDLKEERPISNSLLLEKFGPRKMIS